MKTVSRNISFSGLLVAFTLMLNIIVASKGSTDNTNWYWWLFFTFPLLGVAIWNILPIDSDNKVDRSVDGRRYMLMRKIKKKDEAVPG